MTELEMIEKVQRDPDFLGETKGQTLTVCMAAVRADGLALRHMRVQTSEACHAAVLQNPDAKKFARIPEPIYMDMLPKIKQTERIKDFGYTLKTALSQPEFFCIEAVMSNADALRYVREQTPIVCWAAVLKSGMALQYVKEQTPELCLAAVRKSGQALQYVKKKKMIICLEAVIRCPSALAYAGKYAPALLKVAKLLDSTADRYIKEPKRRQKQNKK